MMIAMVMSQNDSTAAFIVKHEPVSAKFSVG